MFSFYSQPHSGFRPRMLYPASRKILQSSLAPPRQFHITLARRLLEPAPVILAPPARNPPPPPPPPRPHFHTPPPPRLIHLPPLPPPPSHPLLAPLAPPRGEGSGVRGALPFSLNFQHAS